MSGKNFYEYPSLFHTEYLGIPVKQEWWECRECPNKRYRDGNNGGGQPPRCGCKGSPYMVKNDEESGGTPPPPGTG